MNIDLSPYKSKRICVAVSGGKDSMALLDYLRARAAEYGITLSALNCEHGIRGEESERDSAFVAAYCGGNGIPLHFFKAQSGAFNDEEGARRWRINCYKSVIERGQADFVATAHHMNDNAETVLFNLARGSSLNGLTGIADNADLKLIRPLICCSRGDIDGYIEKNSVKYVTDSTNQTDIYTRNKIRRNVIPALESAVDGAVKNIYRFSRLAAEDEEYFNGEVEKIVVGRAGGSYVIKSCPHRVIFRRAAQKIVAKYFNKKDYTTEHLNRLFVLQVAENGKRFEFLGLVAIKEEGGVALLQSGGENGYAEPVAFREFLDGNLQYYGGNLVRVSRGGCSGVVAGDGEKCGGEPLKTLKFDLDKLPRGAVVRFKREGDRFTKFGGGTKSLSDWLTDKKAPQSLRASVPLVCLGNEVYIVGGAEISEKIKVDESTVNTAFIVCRNLFGGN